jgi:hypothetical protein
LGHDRRFSRPERAKCAAARHPPPVSGIKEGFHTVWLIFETTGRLSKTRVFERSATGGLTCANCWENVSQNPFLILNVPKGVG